MSSRRPIHALLLVAAAAVLGSACGSDDGSAAAPGSDRPVTAPAGDQASADPSEDGSSSGSGSGTGSATLEVDGERWTFDTVTCGFGEEGTGVAGATWNMAARNGSLSLYATIEPDLTSIELADLEDADAPNLMTTGTVTIDLDGDTARGSATFIDVNGDTGIELAGTLEVSCP